MANIPHAKLFSREQVDASSALNRLWVLLESQPDESTLRALEDARKGRLDE